MEISVRANLRIQTLKEEITYKFPDLLYSFPIDFYTSDVKSYPLLSNYHHISSKLEATFNKIISQYNLHGMALYHKLALSFLVADAVSSGQNKRLPENVRLLSNEWFERVLDDISIQPDDYYTHKNDSFLKDLAGCCLRLIPVGAWAVEVSGIERRFLFMGDFKQFYQSLLFLIFKMKGFKPFYQIHTVLRYVQGFNPEGREKCYLRIAEMLKRNSEIKGMFALSWLYDPQLESVSPRLAYLRLLPEKYGAKVFHIGTRQVDINNALVKSPTRRKLFKEGKYMPTAYIKIWPRKELIAWADRRLGSSSLP